MINIKQKPDKERLKITFIDVCLVALLIVIGFIRLIRNNSTTILISQAVILGCGALGFLTAFFDRQLRVFYYAFFAVFCYALSLILRHEWSYEMSSFVQSVCYMGAAYLLFRKKHHVLPYRVVYYAVCAFMIFQLLIRNVPIRRFLKDGNSYNFISVIALFYLSVYVLVQLQNNIEPGYLQAALFLIIAVAAYGRSGIVVAVFFMFLVIFRRIHLNKRDIFLYLVTAAFVLLLFIYGGDILNYILKAGYFEKFTTAGLDTPRPIIWRLFWETCTSGIRLFVSGGIPTSYSAEGNLHNSFLQMYTSLGAAFFCVTVILLIRAAADRIKKRDYWGLMMPVTLFMRAFMDKLFYKGYCEIILYYFIFQYVLKKRTEN